MSAFIPHGQVTGIGSLPHQNADDAVQFVARYSPTIPFWAQLPGRSLDEMMVTQMLAPLRDLLVQHSAARLDIRSGSLDEFRHRLREADARLDEASAAGFFAFERACAAGLFPEATALKGQLTGPITLAHCLFYEQRPLASQPEIYADLAAYLGRLGKWQLQRLSIFGKPVILFVDEPALSLGAFSTPANDSLKQLIDTLRATGAVIGIHCCASNLPGLICRAMPDMISFDAHMGLEGFLANAAVRDYVQAGGWLVLGLVPTLDDVTPFDTTGAFLRLVAAVESLADLPDVAARCLITATCGLGLLTVESAQASFEKCQALSQLMQRTLRVEV